MEEEDYLKTLFDAMDGKVKFKDLDKKKRGRRAGYKHSPETRDKIAKQMKGRVKDDETKDKISKSLLGREKPLETRRKISKSKTHNSVAGDLLHQYSGVNRERDIPTSTHEYLSKVGGDPLDVCQWIKDNFEAINEGQGADEIESRCIRWEADLNAEMKKEEPNLDEIGLIGGLWRP
jgi:hypothetical protein